MNLKTMLISVASAALLFACSDDGENTTNGSAANSAANATNSTNATNATNSTSNNGDFDCIAAQNDVASAIRALPRECINDSDCMIVERAAQCECANSIRDGVDLSEFESALQVLDAGECGHPFACATPSCNYESGFDGAEVVPICEADGTCGLTSSIACDVYETKIYGGISPGGACQTDADCTLRDDLNPCGCNEGVTVNFPILLAQAIYDMMEVNRDRCSFTCEICPELTTAACVDDGSGTKTCKAL